MFFHCTCYCLSHRQCFTECLYCLFGCPQCFCISNALRCNFPHLGCVVHESGFCRTSGGDRVSKNNKRFHICNILSFNIVFLKVWKTEFCLNIIYCKYLIILVLPYRSYLFNFYFFQCAVFSPAHLQRLHFLRDFSKCPG